MPVQKNTRTFAELASDIENLSESIAPARRAELMKAIAAEILRRHRARIKANIEPDGSPMASRQGERFKFRRLRDGEGLKGRDFRFLGGNRAQYYEDVAYSRTENGNELVRLKGNRGLLGFKREHLFIETGRRARLQLFRKLGRARWLRSKADSSEALIGWLGGSAAVIARDHDEGNSKKNIPSRLLLGLSKDDLLYIQEQILNAVNGGFTD